DIRVTSPRFKLPPDQLLSAFPPANSEGAYESRLPQIVLKRRTLPWERAIEPSDPNMPWLALVVIAEGEGEISSEAPIAECVTPGVTLSGPNDVARGVYLSVPQTTVTKVFPTKQDLPLLAHVREVDLEDTELANGDDDGFLAVVMANRLPQFDRVACKPVRYTACLINLEGQLKALPPPSTPRPDFFALATVFDIREYYASPSPGESGGSPDIVVMGSQIAGATSAPFLAARGAAAAPAVQTTASVKAPAARSAKSASPKPGAAKEWSISAKAIEDVALTASSERASFAVRDAMKGGFRFPIEGVVLEKVYRFPILAHWSFTCDGGGSFESLMRGIDVGLLGTLPGPGAKRARPECAPAPLEGPPDAPSPRPPAEVAETGHVGLAHTTRAGDDVRAWYRGPFVPSPMLRETIESTKPVLAHASDQLRSVVPDGREDLSLTIAFEIGRLLALSRPAFVSALMQWRREQFGAERARRLARLAGNSIGKLADILKEGVVTSLGPLIGKTFVLETAAKPENVLGEFRPLVEPGRPIEFLDDDVTDILSVGLAIDASILREMQNTGSAAPLDRATVPLGKTAGGVERFGHLSETLSAEVQRVATDAVGKRRPPPNRRRVARTADEDNEPDALDKLIDALTRRKQED
ncbi:MAG TPA: hypothetical protein VLF14_09360, partial [Candidatus Binatia bacterium]|nr:hypothetical protein [Candidatus Binatia bacterium]